MEKLLFNHMGAQPGHFVGRGNDPTLGFGCGKNERHT